MIFKEAFLINSLNFHQGGGWFGKLQNFFAFNLVKATPSNGGRLQRYVVFSVSCLPACLGLILSLNFDNNIHGPGLGLINETSIQFKVLVSILRL